MAGNFIEYNPGDYGDISMPEFREAKEATQSKTSGGDKNPSLDIDLKGLKALPSDSDVLLNYAKSINKKRDSMTEDEAMNSILTFQKITNDAAYNKELDTKAREALKTNKSSETVYVDNGRVLIGGNEGYRFIPVSDWDPQSQYALSTSDVLNLRANNSAYAFNSDIFQQVSGIVGEELVSEKIRNVVSNLDKTKTDSKTVLTKEQMAAQKIAETAYASDSYETFNYELSNEGISQETMKLALNYIYKSLSQAEKNTLSVSAKQNGTTESEMIISALMYGKGGVTTKFSITGGIKEDGSESGKPSTRKTGSSGSGSGEEVTLSENLIAGLGQSSKIELYPSTAMNGGIGGNHQITADATTLQGIRKSGDSVSDFMTDNNIWSSMDSGTMTFGGMRIRPGDLKNIEMNGNSLSLLSLPIKYDGTPNFELAEKLDRVLPELQTAVEAKDKNAIYQLLSVPLDETYKVSDYILLNKEGQLVYNPNRMGKFFAMDAVMDTDIDADEDNGLLFAKQIKEDTPEYESHKNTLGFKSGSKPTRSVEDNIFRGQVFIKANDNIIHSVAGRGKVEMDKTRVGNGHSFTELEMKAEDVTIGNKPTTKNASTSKLQLKQ